jgi:HD-like signal output (HDOD) protein
MSLTQEPTSNNLAHWVQRLTSRDMPIFAQTAKKISVVSSLNQSSAAVLANAILQDALMTSKVLKMANSAFYMGGRRSPLGGHNNVNTVTRAVMILGFDTIRAVCQTKAVVESLLQGTPRERLTQIMACAFHAAVQARWLAEKTRDESPEEIFIAAFLYLLGEMAFWCFAGEELTQQLEQLLLLPENSRIRAEQDLLGFSFEQLTLALSKEWHLSPLLLDALESRQATNPRIKNILWGQKLARTVQKGWPSTEVRQLIDQVSDSLNLPQEIVAPLVHKNAAEAIRTAVSFGATQASRLIPVPPESSRLETQALETRDDPTPALHPDPNLQLKILHELSSLMLEKKPDYGVFITLVLEGIFRAVSMDRVFFALRTPDRSRLEIKFQLGWHGVETPMAASFKPVLLNNNIFSEVMEKKAPLWIDEHSLTGVYHLITEDVISLIGTTPFFIMPIVAHDKSIALIYADRQPSGRALDDESYNDFKHFCQQAIIGLTLITQPGSAIN